MAARYDNLFDVPARQATYAGGIGSLASIPGLLKRFHIRALVVGSWDLYYTHPLIPCAVKEEDAEAQHTVHDGEGAVQSHILNTPK